MATPTGAPISNPVTALPTIVETVEASIASSTLNGAITSGVTTVVVVSGVPFSADDYVILDQGGSSPEVVQIETVASNTLTLYTPTKYSHSSGASVVLKVMRQSFVIAPNKKTIITPSTTSGTTTNIFAGIGIAVKIVNASPQQQNILLSLFDEGLSPGGLSADLIYSVQDMGPSEVIVLEIPVTNGLSFLLSGSAVANIILVWN